MLQGGGSDFPGARAPIRPRRRLLPYLVLALILVVVGFVGANVWLRWTIFEYMYSTKAGLDWFSIAFYGGLTFVVGGILALFFINPNPRRSDIFEAFNALMGLQYRNPYFGNYSGQPSQRRARPMYIRPSKILWGFWQILKWVILFALFSANNGFPGFGNLTIVLDMALRGYGSWSLVPRIITLPINPASGTELISLIPTMEIQYQLIVYFLNVLMAVVAIRFFLKLIRDVVIRAGDKWIRDIFVILTAIMFSVLIEVPYWGMDITIAYEFGAVATVFVAFLVLALFFQIKSSRETIPLAQRRRMGVVAATIIIIAILLFNVGAITYYRLNWNNNWVQYEWTPLTQKQITVTRYAAGIQNMSYAPISTLPSGNATTTLSLIRQWDSNASQIQSQNRIGVNYLQALSPEIVYEYGQEYWVTPTTFLYPAQSSDWISTHLIYTHSSKIIVMNSHTGQFVNATQAFKIPQQPLMYYGVGFSNEVYVHVNGEPSEVDNVVYSGQPDYTLCGAQRAVWFLSQAQVGFALSPPQGCIDMLYQQDPFQRVQNVLIGGLVEDGSTYLVTDSAAGGNSLYFAVQVYIDYPIHTGFSDSSYLRFFGVVLVNVANGSMQGYTVAQNDGFLSSFYKQYYPSWGQVPSWLQPQLRYPEQLLGNQNAAGQLDVDFTFHVQNPSIWRSGTDFFERPPSTQVLYIPFVIGNQVSFTAIQLVEFQSSPGKNLAGFYVVYGGNQLGQMALYESNSTTINTTPLLGPSAALNAFNTDQTTRTALTLTGAVPGNILLYPVNGHLFYFIPAYIFPGSSSGGGSSVVAKNPFIDVIDAQNPSAPVRFVNTTSTEDLSYGLLNTTVTTNPALRLQYLQNLFTSQGSSLANVTAQPSTTFQSGVGVAQYTLDAQNATATQLVNSFITSYVKNSTLTGGHIAFNHVYFWTPAPGTIDFGIVVADPAASGITELYYISLYAGQ